MKGNVVISRNVVVLFTMLAPEYLVLHAVGEFITARESAKKLQDLTKMEFSLIHGFSLDMGGVCLYSANKGYHQICRRHIKCRGSGTCSKKSVCRSIYKRS